MASQLLRFSNLFPVCHLNPSKSEWNRWISQPFISANMLQLIEFRFFSPLLSSSDIYKPRWGKRVSSGPFAE